MPKQKTLKTRVLLMFCKGALHILQCGLWLCPQVVFKKGWLHLVHGFANVGSGLLELYTYIYLFIFFSLIFPSSILFGSQTFLASPPPPPLPLSLSLSLSLSLFLCLVFICFFLFVPFLFGLCLSCFGVHCVCFF